MNNWKIFQAGNPEPHNGIEKLPPPQVGVNMIMTTETNAVQSFKFVLKMLS